MNNAFNGESYALRCQLCSSVKKAKNCFINIILKFGTDIDSDKMQGRKMKEAENDESLQQLICLNNQEPQVNEFESLLAMYISYLDTAVCNERRAISNKGSKIH